MIRFISCLLTTMNYEPTMTYFIIFRLCHALSYFVIVLYSLKHSRSTLAHTGSFFSILWYESRWISLNIAELIIIHVLAIILQAIQPETTRLLRGDLTTLISLEVTAIMEHWLDQVHLTTEWCSPVHAAKILHSRRLQATAKNISKIIKTIQNIKTIQDNFTCKLYSLWVHGTFRGMAFIASTLSEFGLRDSSRDIFPSTALNTYLRACQYIRIPVLGSQKGSSNIKQVCFDISIYFYIFWNIFYIFLYIFDIVYYFFIMFFYFLIFFDFFCVTCNHLHHIWMRSYMITHDHPQFTPTKRMGIWPLEIG